tara:strand:+ start:177 stop:1211 length:1035 start_codon:yes stop_codon:yes gene_type:complete
MSIIFKKKLLTNFKYKLRVPPLSKISEKKIFINEINRNFKSVYLFKINNVFISKTGTPILFNFKILFDYLKFNSLSGLKRVKKILLLIKYYKYFIKIKSFSKLKNIDVNEGIFISDRHSVNYYHWLTDVLPKIFLIKKLKKYKNIPIIIPKYKTSFQIDSINLLNKNIKTINKNSNIKNFYYISELHVSGCPRPKYIKDLKKFLIKKINRKRNYPKIYISRRFSDYRKILNEKKLIKFLKDENFKIIHAEKLSFIEQIRCFSNAKFVISSHGAGLTNLIWMKPKSKILEIRSANPTQNSNYVLCNTFKIKYFYHLVRQVNYSSNGSYLFKLDEFKKYYNNIKSY